MAFEVELDFVVYEILNFVTETNASVSFMASLLAESTVLGCIMLGWKWVRKTSRIRKFELAFFTNV